MVLTFILLIVITVLIFEEIVKLRQVDISRYQQAPPSKPTRALLRRVKKEQIVYGKILPFRKREVIKE